MIMNGGYVIDNLRIKIVYVYSYFQLWVHVLLFDKQELSWQDKLQGLFGIKDWVSKGYWCVVHGRKHDIMVMWPPWLAFMI